MGNPSKMALVDAAAEMRISTTVKVIKTSYLTVKRVVVHRSILVLFHYTHIKRRTLLLYTSDWIERSLE